MATIPEVAVVAPTPKVVDLERVRRTTRAAVAPPNQVGVIATLSQGKRATTVTC